MPAQKVRSPLALDSILRRLLVCLPFIATFNLRCLPSFIPERSGLPYTAGAQSSGP